MTFRKPPFLRNRSRKSVKNLIPRVVACFAIVVCLSIFDHGLLRFHPLPILWSRVGLEECLSSECLLTYQFREQKLSTRDATAALENMHIYLSRTPLQPPPLPQDFLEAASRATCAVVGGAPLPSYVSCEEQAQLVDSTTDLTIRLNIRTAEFLQAEGVSAPLGSRTDVLIIQRGSLRSFERYIHGWGEGNATRGRIRQLAGERFKQYSRPLLVFRPECPSRFQSCPNAWAALGNSSLPSWMDLFMLHYDIEMQTNRLLKKAAGKRSFRIGTDIPSTGIVAVVTALNMCNRVNVFAFNGSVHGDGDVPRSKVWRGHKLRIERKLLRQLESCKTAGFERLCGKLRIYS